MSLAKLTPIFSLSSTEFDTYLADFPCFTVTEAAECEGHIMVEEIWQALKKVGTDKTARINDLPYKVSLRLSSIFVPLLATIYNN